MCVFVISSYPVYVYGHRKMSTALAEPLSACNNCAIAKMNCIVNRKSCNLQSHEHFSLAFGRGSFEIQEQDINLKLESCKNK